MVRKTGKSAAKRHRKNNLIGDSHINIDPLCSSKAIPDSIAREFAYRVLIKENQLLSLKLKQAADGFSGAIVERESRKNSAQGHSFKLKVMLIYITYLAYRMLPKFRISFRSKEV